MAIFAVSMLYPFVVWYGLTRSSPHLLAVSLPLKLYPVLVNAVLLVNFGWSLYSPPSVIERLAQLRKPALPPEAIAYTRRVTQVWCVFFVLNGLIALYTALQASTTVWTLYNGIVAYVMIGALLAGELLVRRRVMGRRSG